MQNTTARADAYDREAEKINTLRNLRKIHIDDEGKMVINDDDLYAPVLYHTADNRPQIPHHIQPPVIRDSKAPVPTDMCNRQNVDHSNGDMVDSGNNSMTESFVTDTGQLEDIPLFEDGHVENHDHACSQDVTKEEADLCNAACTLDGQVGPENVGILGNMKRMLASFFETFDESDADSATTEGT